MPARARRLQRAVGASAIPPGSVRSNGIRYRTTGPVRDLRASFVRSPELRIPLRAVASAGAPPIVPRSAWGADESIRKGTAVVRACDPLRERPPHGRHEQLLARAGGGDHARDRGLPRQVERLERHRLQLPRRPLRHRLRGPLRRHRPQRDRRLCPRLQHRLDRRRRDRDVQHGGDPGCRRDVAREAPRLAARPRPRRSRLDAHVRLGRQRALSRRRPRSPARRLGTPRHGADDVPRQPALREARHDRGEDAGDRAAEALRAEGDRRPRWPGAVPGPRLLGPRVEGDGHRRARAAARARHRAGADRRLHLGRIARHRAGRHLADRRCRRHARVGHVREGSRRRRPARDHRSRRRPGHDQPERRRPGRLGHDHLHDERDRDRHRDAARRRRRPARDDRHPGQARRRASTRSRSTGSVSQTASTRSSSPRSTRWACRSRAS